MWTTPAAIVVLIQILYGLRMNMASIPPNNNLDSRTVPEISPLEFVRALEAGETIQVVDVRSPETFSS